jgi:predicted Rossmann-fold nucleotide-binding protein
MSQKVKTLCVFCGSSKGSNKIYEEHAQRLGEAMVERNIDLVYGGSAVGMMGVLANAVHSKGGQVTGVIPHALAGQFFIAIVVLFICLSVCRGQCRIRWQTNVGASIGHF